MTVFLAQSSSEYTGQYLIPLILTWTFIPKIVQTGSGPVPSTGYGGAGAGEPAGAEPVCVC